MVRVKVNALCTLMIGAIAAGSVQAAPPPGPPPAPAPQPPPAPNGPFPDNAGQWSNFSTAPLSTSSPFFASLGANGRTCATCHAPADAWTATPGRLSQRFQFTGGNDPIFAAIDGTNCPGYSPANRQQASSLLLNKGLIRVALAPPATAQFTVASVVNPYGCTATSPVSVYRRILPTASLPQISSVMWDARNSITATSLNAAFLKQAGDAITGHAQAPVAPPQTTLQALVSFELAIFSAQVSDIAAGALDAAGAHGGPVNLAQQTFTPGANDPFAPTTPVQGVPPAPVFTIFQAWETLPGVSPANLARASIARGEKIFNTRPMTIRTVAGLTDQLDKKGQPRATVTGTCGTCHNAPNVGSNTAARMFDTGVANVDSRTADLPVITLRNKTTGVTIQTTDPGLALTTGLWSDVNRFKAPGLRNLAARGPYFHNGSAGNLDAVVNFYNNRFNLNLTTAEHNDLVAFLRAL